MPNWCSVDCVITGPELAKFREALTVKEDGSVSLLEAFVPMPPDIGDGWYDWRLSHWSCKWPDDMTIVQDDSDTIVVAGDTPWSPPINGYVAVSKLFPSLTFSMSWDEEGMAFMGAAVIQAGEIIGLYEITGKEYPSCSDWDNQSLVDAFYDEVVERREACRKLAAS